MNLTKRVGPILSNYLLCMERWTSSYHPEMLSWKEHMCWQFTSCQHGKSLRNSDTGLCSYIDSVMYSDCIPLTMPGSVESYANISYMYTLWNYITYKALNSLGCGIYFESCTVLIFKITLWWIKNTYSWLLKIKKLYIHIFLFCKFSTKVIIHSCWSGFD